MKIKKSNRIAVEELHKRYIEKGVYLVDVPFKSLTYEEQHQLKFEVMHTFLSYDYTHYE